MKRQLLFWFALAAVLVGTPIDSACAAGGRGHGHGLGHAHRGFGGGFGIIGGGYDYGWDIAELYRQLYNNLPYFALHPPVYYSQPVPRTYGYSPFAYLPDIMTPEIVEDSKPVTIINPYVPGTQPASTDAGSDRAASTANSPEPLVIKNPFATPSRNVVKSGP
jgi:hypothetical protein